MNVFFQMYEVLPPLDWSFLGHDVKFCMTSISTCAVLFLRNNFQEPQILYVNDMTSMADLVQIHLNEDEKTLQVIVKNGNSNTNSMCPYLHLFMDKCSPKTPVNHSLIRLLRECEIENVNPRCHTALVLGLSSFDTSTATPVDLPVEMTSSYTPGVFKHDTLITTRSDCPPTGEPLYGYQDILLPVYLPREVQWNIFSYLSTPTSSIIKAELLRINMYWNLHFSSVSTEWNDGYF